VTLLALLAPEGPPVLVAQQVLENLPDMLALQVPEAPEVLVALQVPEVLPDLLTLYKDIDMTLADTDYYTGNFCGHYHW